MTDKPCDLCRSAIAEFTYEDGVSVCHPCQYEIRQMIYLLRQKKRSFDPVVHELAAKFLMDLGRAYCAS
jgi:hypothetical protein